MHVEWVVVLCVLVMLRIVVCLVCRVRRALLYRQQSNVHVAMYAFMPISMYSNNKWRSLVLALRLDA